MYFQGSPACHFPDTWIRSISSIDSVRPEFQGTVFTGQFDPVSLGVHNRCVFPILLADFLFVSNYYSVFSTQL